MVTLEQFKQNAVERGICSLVSKWDKCGSKKQLIDLALDVRSIHYIANAIFEGWGISPDAIEEEFKPFLNGRYRREIDGYTSAVYCGHTDDKIKINATVTLVIGFNGTIIPPIIGELYLVNSTVKLKGAGSVVAYLYNSDIVSSNKAEVRIKENRRY